MSEKVENTSGGALDTIKWLVVFAILAGIIAGNSALGEVSVLYRALAAVAGVVIAGFIAASTVKGSIFLNYAKESRIEVRKVVWPSRQEATQTSIIVIIATIVVGLILYVLDLGIVWVVGLITGIGS